MSISSYRFVFSLSLTRAYTIWESKCARKRRNGKKYVASAFRRKSAVSEWGDWIKNKKLKKEDTFVEKRDKKKLQLKKSRNKQEHVNIFGRKRNIKDQMERKRHIQIGISWQNDKNDKNSEIERQ